MAQYGLTISTAPTSEPVSLAEAKLQCGVSQDVGYFNEKLEALVKAAREKVEADTGRALMTQTVDYSFDLFPLGLQAIYLPRAPVASVTHVKYFDTTNSEQTLATSVYKTFLTREPAEIRLKNAQQWPSLYGEQGVITVRFVAGYTSALNVPESLKQAVKLLLKAWFDDAEVPEDTYRSLIARWQIGDEFHCYSRSFEYA